MAVGTHFVLVSAFPPGRQSLNEYGYHLARGLADRPDVAKVTVLADLLDDPTTAELDLGPKIEVRRVWKFNTLGSLFKIVSSLVRLRPDGVIYNLQTATFGDREVPAALGLFAPMIGQKLGIPSGVIAHNIIAGIDLEHTQLKGKRLRQMIVKAGGAIVTRAMLGAKYMTVTLQGYLDYMSSKYPKAPVYLVPHGTFETNHVNCQPISHRPLRIATMGKFGTYKRLETLLSAFDILRQSPEFAEAELWIGGTDHPATPGYLGDLAEQRRNDKSVHFAGYLAEDDIPEFFCKSRICVFDYTSTTGSSGVLHQAASFGAVPVFPRIGDFVNICEDEGITGMHFEPSDPTDMANAMREVLSNPDKAQMMSEQNLFASAGMPFSEVVDFHVRELGRKPNPKTGRRIETVQ